MFLKKSKVEQSGDEMKIIIPSEKNLKFPLFAILWFVAWYFVYKFAIQSEDIFIQIWLVFWSFAGLFMMYLLLWFLFGYERLKISRKNIIFSVTVFRLGLKRSIEMRQFRSCFYNQDEIDKRNEKKGTYYLNSLGKIKIEHQFSSYSFGGALDEDEARYIIGIINKHIIQLQ